LLHKVKALVKEPHFVYHLIQDWSLVAPLTPQSTTTTPIPTISP
jgi:hypothetical protein